MNQNYNRFQKPNEGEAYPSEYDLSSAMIQDPITRDIAPIYVESIDLSTAGSKTIFAPGRGFVAYGYTTGSEVKTRKTDVLVNVQMNDPNAPVFPAKHNRGFRGSFAKLIVSWPAQANSSVDLVILRSMRDPWDSDG